ncbi:MAG TPA: penicillin-binding transpeptidase domain-containing protein [Longimicrobiaceae bacterium]|nr:penicillin-binding transpeptidase domain-containing protein [Longimicrobiaceae bacterium]
MVDTLLDWILRGILALFGVGALVALLRSLRAAFGQRRERWAVRIAVGMFLFALVYAGGHLKLLADRDRIEAGRAAYSRFGDPRAAELNRAELRGWIYDCTGQEDKTLARYGVRDGEVQRIYPLDEAGANLVGGGAGAEDRDYTVERLFAKQLREPHGWDQSDNLHPVGTDMKLTLCSEPTREAWRLLNGQGREGAVIVQDVKTGALVAYAATGAPNQAPFGIKRYAPPGSVFKLALSAVWWDHGLGDVHMPCPPRVMAGNRAIRNFESHEFANLEAPREMLRVSCNTAAIQMAFIARQRLGVQPFIDQYRSFGFEPYSDKPAVDTQHDFWSTSSDAWAQRMSPPQARLRILSKYNLHEWALLAIGQGPVDVTPIAVSRFVQSIGNGGVMMQPSIEADRVAHEGRRVMKATTAAKLQEAMLEVVHKGTAVSVLPTLLGTGWDMGGKTGTADVAHQATPDGWFAGLMFGPDGRAKYTVVVYVRKGGQGGRVPGAIAAGMTRYMASGDRSPLKAQAARAQRQAYADGTWGPE